MVKNILIATFIQFTFAFAGGSYAAYYHKDGTLGMLAGVLVGSILAIGWHTIVYHKELKRK